MIMPVIFAMSSYFIPTAVDQDILVRKAIFKPSEVKSMANDKSPVTKAELIVILTKLVTYLESSKKQPGAVTSTTKIKTIRDLVKAGYLPADTPLLDNSNANVSRDLLSSLLSTILIRHNEKVVPITPNSRRATPIPHPSENSGS